MNNFDFIIFGLMIIIPLLIFCYLLFLWILDIIILHAYNVTEAKVINYHIARIPKRKDYIEKYGYLYLLNVVYEYQINGVSYQSNKLNVFNNACSSQEKDIEKWLYTKDGNKYIKVYVNPKKPSQVYACPTKWRKPIILFFMSLNLLSVAVGLLGFLTNS